ncbi:MAG TPA: tryptophan 2,3-dioxygenase [Balneolaceae bacterium]|nr:tryptophan 2,3-dioxygenase [Balneolaceae bacterium]|tara:strand:+ start:265171 stop:265950 length:780 start_codon:yes stop_codon:yes gene_type:complete
MDITYTNYLKIDELTNLQQLKSDPPEHDEMLFIIIHQTYELWFKQILHEIGKLNLELQAGNTWNSLKTMRRILTVMKTLVSQVDILETMTPLEFNNFRAFLGQSSGFQSLQFRELEILCGLRLPLMKEAHKNNAVHLERLEQRMKLPTLWESFCAYITQKGYPVSPIRENEVGLLFNPSSEIQQQLITVMKNDPEAALVCELLVDFDEGLQEWRYRHVKMVERTIGTKKGTGGSDGVRYLKGTTHHAIFPDLWAIRSEF